MAIEPINDARFGTLLWDADNQEWDGTISIPPHEGVGLILPSEYRDSDEIRAHIRWLISVIERDELTFRQQAARDLFAQGEYILWWDEDQPFDCDEFARQMVLGTITLNTEYPHRLGYEYAEGREHGMHINLTWDGVYRSASTT